MSIWIPLNLINDIDKDIISEELNVIQLDEYYEKMKKRGKIIPGYTPDPTKNILCFNIDKDKNIWLPYFYARSKFKIIPKLNSYDILNPLLLNHVQLRDTQIDTTTKCFHDLIKHGTTTVGLPPGYGKTYIGAYLAHCLKLKVLIIVPRTPLLKQWEKTFQTAIPGINIWIIDQNGTLPKDGIIPDVTIALDPRISKIPTEWKSKIGTLIIDEAHMLPTRARIENLLSLKPAYIILETATMVRDDNLHKICELIGGSHGVFKTADDPYTFNIVDLPFINAVEKSSIRGVDYGALCDSLSNIDEYNRVIVNIIRHNPNNKFIVLTKRVEHGKYLVNLLRENNITADSMMGTKKTYQNSKVLIGTFSKIGTGFDEATASDNFTGELSDSLIICHSVSKVQNFEQFRGRVMRTKNPNVYWLNVGNRVIRSQLTDIKKHVIKTNGNIVIKPGKQYLYDKPEKE